MLPDILMKDFGFRWVDIFASKGIEYIFVIIYLFLFVPFVKLLRGGKKDE